MTGTNDRRGVLYPAELPSFTRIPAPADLREQVRWIWIPRWDLAPGQVSRQKILPFPASNLVITATGVALVGPTTGLSHRKLSGSGWAVGVLLRLAAAGSLQSDLSECRDSEVAVKAPELHRLVTSAMCQHDRGVGHEHAVAACTTWMRNHLPTPGKAGLLANTMEQLIASDRSIIRVEQVAERLDTSIRSVQRLAQRYIGLPPLSIIRRYRLQEAAQQLRDDPSLTITTVAASLGYADHAHLTRDFQSVLGVAPTAYRRHSGYHPKPR